MLASLVEAKNNYNTALMQWLTLVEHNDIQAAEMMRAMAQMQAQLRETLTHITDSSGANETQVSSRELARLAEGLNALLKQFKLR